MADRTGALVIRLLGLDFAGSFDRTTSRGYLMKEYLRRAAWWTQSTQATGYPFPDLAAAVAPEVRADHEVVARVEAHLAAKRQGKVVQRVCINALHFVAVQEAGVPLPDAPAEPFEPLLVMFERGGGFRVEGAGLIEVDTLGLRVGTLAENLRAEPYVALDRAALDALDAAGP